MPSSIVSPFPVFNDLDGSPLENGYIYIGTSNLNPETSPVNVYWDAARTIPAAQPIRTIGGFPSRNGSPSNIYVEADTYSITVRNSRRVFVYSALDQTGIEGTVYSISTQLITASAGQTVFSLTTFQYIPATKTLEVYKNGLRLNLGIDYTETNSSTVTLTSPTSSGDKLLFQGGSVASNNVVPGTSVSFIQAGTGAVTRNMQDKIRESVSVKDFGAVGDGATDDTAAIQAAIDFASANNLGAKVFFPQGTYRTTSVISITGAVTLRGVYARAEKLNTTPKGGGTWFFIDHTGRGFSIVTPGGSVVGDIYFSNFGTYRNQPTPGSSWAPNNHDFDFWLQGAQDVTWDDVILLNPTKGISSTGSGGRLNFYKLRGQPFQTGIYIDKAYDVCRFDQIHFWQFWSQDTNVVVYTQANLNAINLLRCDNPMLSNFFVYGALNGILISQGTNGTTSKLHLVNADFDGTAVGLNVDASVDGATLQLDNITHLGSPLPNSRLAFIQGSNNNICLGSSRTTGCSQEVVRVSGTSNTINIAECVAATWATAGGAINAFYTSATSRINFAIPPLLGVNAGSGTVFNAGGQISAGRWIDWTPVITTASGTITSYTAIGKYKVQDLTVYYEIEINISNNGTGSGAIISTLPFSVPLNSSVGVGRELLVNGKSLTATQIASSSTMDILNYDNSYPGVNGCRLIVNGSYIIG